MKQGWEIKKLGEVCDIICGQDYKLVKDDNGKYPIYGTGGIMGYASQYRCPAKSVIIGRKGNINNPIYVETEFWNVDTAFGVVPNTEELHPKFFFLFCKDYDFTRHDVSVTIPSLRRTDILKIDVPVPPLSEQEKIVAELDCLSGIIEKKKQQLKEYDALAQSIFYEMFGNPIDNEKGWEVKTLGDVCNFINGYAFKSQLFVEEGDKILRISNIQDGCVDITDAAHFDKKDYPKVDFKKYAVFPNDIVIALSGATTGKLGINKTGNTLYLNQRVAICREKNNDINHTYLLFYLMKQSASFLDTAAGVAQPNLSTEQMKTYLIGMPPLPIQQEFASKIEAIEKQKELIKQSIAETEILFNSRMDYYFN